MGDRKMDTIVYAVKRKGRRSEKLLRAVMIFFSVIFLLQGILLSRGFLLPCFLTAMAYFWYSGATKREWEYTLNEDSLRIERVSDRGRELLDEIPLCDIEILALPDDPAVAKYRKGGSEKIKKFDYTSYEENVPYYTMIAREDGERIKLLLDLTPDALALIRRKRRDAVHC